MNYSLGKQRNTGGGSLHRVVLASPELRQAPLGARPTLRLEAVASSTLISAKDGLDIGVHLIHPVQKRTGLRCDQTVVLTGFYPSQHYPGKLRRIKYHDTVTDKTLIFLTNNFLLPPLTIAKLYRCRWQVELFFKWIKQHLRIKSFFGTTENAVKTQIWIAVSVYVLVAIVKKRLGLDLSLYTILQILSVTIFERMPLIQTLNESHCKTEKPDFSNQLNLFP